MSANLNKAVNTAVLPKEPKSSNIKVIIRFRPFNETETDLFKEGVGYQSCEFIDDKSVIMKNRDSGGEHNFRFDRIFKPDSSQPSIYDYVGKGTLDDVLNGYNGTIFCYGQSGSGKTYTMYGSDIYEEVGKGLIPRMMY